MVAIAEERFAGMEKDINIPIRMVSKTCAILHRQMMAQPVRQRVTSTQYLDMVRVLPQLLKPIQKKLIKIKKNLQTGIDQVHKADVHQKKLSNEISEKEPEIIKLNTEIEQLNKRLSQERINLERASKAFRKKEVLARKKGEETQELAADGEIREYLLTYVVILNSNFQVKILSSTYIPSLDGIFSFFKRDGKSSYDTSTYFL